MGFYLAGWLLNFSLMAQPLYALLKNTKPDPLIWKGQDDLAFNILRENFKKSPYPWTSQSSASPFPYMKGKGLPLEYSSKNKGNIIHPEDIITNHQTLWHGDDLVSWPFLPLSF